MRKLGLLFHFCRNLHLRICLLLCILLLSRFEIAQAHFHEELFIANGL